MEQQSIVIEPINMAECASHKAQHVGSHYLAGLSVTLTSEEPSRYNACMHSVKDRGRLGFQAIRV